MVVINVNFDTIQNRIRTIKYFVMKSPSNSPLQHTV